MKVIRTPGRGPGKRLIFEEQEFDSIALQALRDSGSLPTSPEPIRIDRFVEKHFNLTLEYKNMGESVLGASMFKKTGEVCGMAVAESLGEDSSVNLFRSTVAHEAGHGLLHPILFMQDEHQGDFHIDNGDFRSGRILCRTNDIKPGQQRGYDGRWWEYQANRMIGTLLLPRPLVMQAIAPFLTRTAITGSPVLSAIQRGRAIQSVAEVFAVSTLVAGIRLEDILPKNSGQQEF